MDKHKWGDIRMTGHKIDVLVDLIFIAVCNPEIRLFNLPASWNSARFRPNIKRDTFKWG